MLSQQDQEMRRNVPDPSFVGGSHFCGSGAGNETRRDVPFPFAPRAVKWDGLASQTRSGQTYSPGFVFAWNVTSSTAIRR